MSYRDDGSGIILQVLLQPGDGFGVQVVGGFVEQQDVGLLEQQAAQGHAASFATGNDVHRGVWAEGQRRASMAISRRESRSQALW